MLTIDRQARAWLKRLVRVWRGVNPRLYENRDARIVELFAAEGMNGPLRHDRLELVYMATQREDPSREAFVTLALTELIEDSENGTGSAHLPYQLAWARAGYTLSERTGLPGGILRARWPEVLL